VIAIKRGSLKIAIYGRKSESDSPAAKIPASPVIVPFGVGFHRLLTFLYEMQQVSNSDSTFHKIRRRKVSTRAVRKRPRLRENRMGNWFGIKENKTPGGEQSRSARH
jgi:hypothetical protein